MNHVKTFEFTITYSNSLWPAQAEEGMTWREWVVSDYRIAGASVTPNGTIRLSGACIVCDNDGEVNADDIILAQHYDAS